MKIDIGKEVLIKAIWCLDNGIQDENIAAKIRIIIDMEKRRGKRRFRDRNLFKGPKGKK